MLRALLMLLAVVIVTMAGCSTEPTEDDRRASEVSGQGLPEKGEARGSRPADPSTGATKDEGETGTINGVVTFVGVPPAAKKIPVTKDLAVCGKEQPAEGLIVGPDRGIRNAVVWLADVPAEKGAKPKPSPPLDQKGCRFRPHVLIVPAGGSLEVRNSDGILHNLHTYSTKNTPMNRAQPGFKKTMSVSFGEPEIVKITCDAHPWMSGWIVVASHAHYAVTAGNGYFSLPAIPVGSHELKVWHETLGEVTRNVAVTAGSTTSVTVELGP